MECKFTHRTKGVIEFSYKDYLYENDVLNFNGLDENIDFISLPFDNEPSPQTLICEGTYVEGLFLTESLEFLKLNNNNIRSFTLPSTVKDLYCQGNKELKYLQLPDCIERVVCDLNVEIKNIKRIIKMNPEVEIHYVGPDFDDTDLWLRTKEKFITS